MKMTMAELLSWPKDISLDEYQKRLAAQKRTDRKIRKLSEEAFDIKDALQVLEDEKGSERYNRKAQRLEEVKAEISKIKP
jgi:hypothetical protein